MRSGTGCERLVEGVYDMRKVSRSTAVLAAAAAFAMTASPVMARDWGWGHRHRDRVDAGDVLAGILIIGGIAAVASAASKANKNKQRERDYRYPDDNYPQQRDSDYGNYGNYGNDDRQGQQDYSDRGGINDAIDRCKGEVMRGSTRIDEIDAVNREGDGWRVQGRTNGGGTFSCTIDGDGRIRNVDIDGRAV